MMWRIFLMAVMAACLGVSIDAQPPLEMGKCTGQTDCKACKTCKHCGHCNKHGGECGVKRGQQEPQDQPES